MSEKINGNELERICGGTGKPINATADSFVVECSQFGCVHCHASGPWVTHAPDCPYKDITQSDCDICHWGMCGGPVR